MGQAHRGRPPMVFDWDKAAELIRRSGAKSARAGLRGDWEWTGGHILKDGSPVPKEETYTYLASTWAVPEIEVDGEIHECYRMQEDSPGWDEKTYWPESALLILSGSGANEPAP